MTMFVRLMMLASFGFLMSSCGDSHEKLMDDQLAYMDELSEIIEDTASGELSSSEAAEDIRAWGKKGDGFMERKKVLNKDLSAEDGAKLMKKYQTRAGKAAKRLQEAMNSLQKSGRATQEITDAMMNVKGL